ncbi:MAG TPA: divergent polysaccharide deacetylase family protein [Candidatus Baltobacteraceae bacterium]|jgi:polysaccharide deacetylase 2 family uncharacterized protein YibQ|nr:divergent polysaccharide deacetylase family protein [Candidatus Baltobacteraceae bacterium]
MRTASISLVVIALALASIVAGFAGGQASSHPPAIVALHPNASASTDPVAVDRVRGLLRGVSDEAVADPFSDDDVVVERTPASTMWLKPRLSFVIALTGDSTVLDAQFLRLGVPLAFDLDPAGSDAAAFANLVRSRGDVLLIHLGSAPEASQLRRLQERLGHFDGIASRSSRAMARALEGTGLIFFDESGYAEEEPFARDGVPLVHRDATADDRTSASYIGYMLARTAMRARREGRMVVLLRPLPDSLRALSAFLGTSSAEVVSLH